MKVASVIPFPSMLAFTPPPKKKKRITKNFKKGLIVNDDAVCLHEAVRQRQPSTSQQHQQPENKPQMMAMPVHSGPTSFGGREGHEQRLNGHASTRHTSDAQPNNDQAGRCHGRHSARYHFTRGRTVFL